MTRDEYMIEIQRTWQIDGLTKREEICNAALGLVGEIGEYHGSNLDLSELGDVYYYAHTLQRLLGGAYRVKHEDIGRRIWFLGELAPLVAEAVKKHLFHDAPSDRARALVEELLFNLDDRARLDGTTPARVRAQNIEKLRRRYPNGFEAGGGVR